ncbi:helix-turn-helix domain-containing protein [Jiulongibacter sp. NS-SX5]|uniref:helix-turn-helix domain-containing protein n=1 Tax=Jiulongibacter sp. NS-SX5 TaxID=3463854 RepID=UPI00405A1DC5
MILSRKSFSYKDITVIEKITLKLPFRYEASFQNEGCFLFMKNVNSQVTSVAKTKTISHKEALLLKCGAYFVDWVNNETDEQVEVIAFHLPSSILAELYKQELPISASNAKGLNHVTPIAKDQVLLQFIDHLEFYFENPLLINDELLSLKIKELIQLLLQTGKFQSLNDLFTSIFTRNKVDLTDLVHNHLYATTSIEELAKLSGMSLSSFKRAFQKQFSMPPGEYLRTSRVKKAKSLLVTTTLDISEIAFEVGYSDPSYFTRLFKLKTGDTPTKYRKKYKVT